MSTNRIQTGGSSKASNANDDKEPKDKTNTDSLPKPKPQAGKYVPTCILKYMSAKTRKPREEGPRITDGEESMENVLTDLSKRDVKRFLAIGAIRHYVE